MAEKIDQATIARWRADPASFMEETLADPEVGTAYRLLPAQREFLGHAFQTDESGKLLYPEQVFAAIKKSGKTAFAAMCGLTTCLLFGGRYAECIVVANDHEQAMGRVFEAMRKIVECSPWLRRQARITQDKITFPSLGATIRAIPSNYAGAAGANPTITIFDELWAYTSERARRLWDELVQPPTRKIALRLTVTYAGWEGESLLLEELYKRGRALPEVAPSLRAGDGLLMAWHHEPIAPWQDERWLATMRRSLRASQFLRMIENRFVSAESSFVDMAAWDACTRPGLVPSMERCPVYIGCDASTKRDSSALCAIAFDRKTQVARLVAHRVFTPSPGDPIDFEATIEATILEWQRRYLVRKVWFDPFQMVSVAQRLAKAHVPIEEYPQTVPNLTAATQNLFDLIQARALALYPDAGMRLAVSRAVIVESSRGWRLDKLRQHFHIDVVVALSMACLAAVRGAAEPVYDLFAPGLFDDDEPQEPTWEERERQRRHDELLRKYGQPVSPSPIPPEHVDLARGRELLPHQAEALQRARADAAARRNEPSEGESHGS